MLKMEEEKRKTTEEVCGQDEGGHAPLWRALKGTDERSFFFLLLFRVFITSVIRTKSPLCAQYINTVL